MEHLIERRSSISFITHEYLSFRETCIVYVCTYAYACVHACTCVCSYVCVYAGVCVCKDSYTIRGLLQKEAISMSILRTLLPAHRIHVHNWNMCGCVCVRICMHVCTCTCACMYVCMFICVYVQLCKDIKIPPQLGVFTKRGHLYIDRTHLFASA